MPKIAQNPRKPSRRTLQLQELWLKALSAPIEIPCGDKSSAMNVRFQLYNAVKAVRANPVLNPDLAAAVEELQISVIGDGKDTIRIGRSPAASVLGDAFSKLGITGNAAGTQDETDLEAKASAQRALEMLKDLEPVKDQMPAPGTRVTPYYTR